MVCQGRGVGLRGVLVQCYGCMLIERTRRRRSRCYTAHICAWRSGCRCLRRMRLWLGVHERVADAGVHASAAAPLAAQAEEIRMHVACLRANLVSQGALSVVRGATEHDFPNMARDDAPLRPPAPVLACIGRQLLLQWNLRESLVATACLAGHGGVTLRSASRLPACTYASGACRLCCRSPGVPRGINILRRSGHGEGCPLTPGRSLERT